ncbi:glycoside hydrolase family 20 zincin-like fold domain-containing protein [Candidatus Latescibacterota bacterium]
MEALALKGQPRKQRGKTVGSTRPRRLGAGPTRHATRSLLGSLVLVLAACVLGPCPSASADPGIITPTPKRMALDGGTVPVEDGVIILTSDDPKLSVAAEEINHRLVKELGAGRLPIRRGGRDEVDTVEGLAIVIGVSGTDDMAAVESVWPAPVPEKTEGYGLVTYQAGSRTVAVLAGYDAQGALYAAVTLRYLLDPADGSQIPNGRAVLRLARIEDWPDYRWREVSRGPIRLFWPLRDSFRKGDEEEIGRRSEQYVAWHKQHADLLLRHKVNLTLSPLNEPTGVSERFQSLCKELSDYARARGIEYATYHGYTNVGTYPSDKDDPEKSRCVLASFHKRYFCWSMLDYHRARAEKYAQALAAAGIDWFFLHTVDAGGADNPALWAERCDVCRATYGDDLGLAYATVFGIYYDACRRANPNLKMIAVLNPYSGGPLDATGLKRSYMSRSGLPEDEAERRATEQANWNRNVIRRAGELLPPEIKVCQRETDSRLYRIMSELYGERDFQIYELIKSNQGWEPEFSLEAGCIRSFYRPNHEDVFWPNEAAWGYAILSYLMSAEFAWNVDAPGARDFPGRTAQRTNVEHHLEPGDIAKGYLEKLCRNLFGPEVGPHMVPVYDSNISYAFIERPEEKARLVDLDAAVWMRRMERATARAMESVDRAREVYDVATRAGRRPIADPVGERYFGSMARYVLAARASSAVRARLLDARAAVIGGDGARADTLIAEAKRIIVQERAAWEERRDWMEAVPHFTAPNPSWHYTFGVYHEYDYGLLEKEVAAFEDGRGELFAAHDVPGWFEEFLLTRELLAVPAGGQIHIDGSLDEPAWLTAPPNYYMVNHRTSTLARRQTETRLLYDEGGLYMGFTVYEPGADRGDCPQLPPGQVIHEASVEAFVDANGDRLSYVQMRWDMAGNSAYGRKEIGKSRPVEVAGEGVLTAVSRFADRWALEVRVPASFLGGIPTAADRWRANLCRNLTDSDGELESVSTVLLNGKGFHSPERFAPLVFLHAPPPREKPEVGLEVIHREESPVTTDDGTGFAVAFDLMLDTPTPLRSATLEAEVLVGGERRDVFTVFEEQTVRLRWRTRRAIHHGVGEPVDGIEIRFRLRTDRDEWTFREVFGSPGHAPGGSRD